MNKDKYVFAQLVQFLDNFKYLRIVKKYDGDMYVKSYTCRNQLLTLMFGQLSNRESLRDLIVAMEAHAGKLYHLGIGKSVTRSNLSKANEQRDYRIFEEFAFYMITEARKRRIQIIFELDGHVYAFDSTTIDLCLSVFEWAKFRKHKGGIKVHTLYDVEAQVPAFVHITEAKVHDSKTMSEIPYEKGAHYIFDRGYNDFGNLYTINRIEAFFVIRAKTNVRFKPETWKRRLLVNVISDAIVYFTVYKSSKDYPEKLRKVVCIDPEDGTRYIFLTNNLTASAETIAELYRNRWSVELFFKWIKQHLRIKKFWGTSENAVRIQIHCAIITYCLVAIVQHDMKLERSIYEVLQILGISLTDKTHLRDLFDKSNFKNVNVLYGSSEPNLFNF
ncbi:IS4 family transposase [Bacteroides acidifaciens]|uniref:IS4 family transposase n=1 Tax=Bacteroides acidifaciens TaxID=85831 RepID=UPI002582C830|nr:IS4 family transposase [Bacteroides acidifaciens]